MGDPSDGEDSLVNATNHRGQSLGDLTADILDPSNEPAISRLGDNRVLVEHRERKLSGLGCRIEFIDTSACTDKVLAQSIRSSSGVVYPGPKLPNTIREFVNVCDGVAEVGAPEGLSHALQSEVFIVELGVVTLVLCVAVECLADTLDLLETLDNPLDLLDRVVSRRHRGGGVEFLEHYPGIAGLVPDLIQPRDQLAS